ncbi:MAG: DUF5615 family PIN-like protein [bacterium]|nr:DUF5615 family PIN-like protein [bacterium]
MKKEIKFLADENIPLKVISNLLRDRIDIIAVAEKSARIKDEEILELAKKEGRVIITFDKDFGELVFRKKRETNGVILLQLHPQTQEKTEMILKKVCSLNIDFSSSFCIVKESRIKVISLRH